VKVLQPFPKASDFTIHLLSKNPLKAKKNITRFIYKAAGRCRLSGECSIANLIAIIWTGRLRLSALEDWPNKLFAFRPF
jgi:hypothetical protein